jgi:molybdate transport system substrate-binding protein
MKAHVTRAAMLGSVVFAFATAVQAAEIKVLASNAVTHIMSDLVPQFEQATGHKVTAIYEPTSAILARIKNGETSDVVILIKGPVAELTKAGKVKADGQADIAKTRLGLAVKTGAPKPDISTPDAFRQAMLNAKSVASSEVGASGLHFMKVLDQLGIAEAVKPKVKVVPGARLTAELVVSGEAEMAIQMMSELLPVAGAEIVGPFPGHLAFEIILSCAVSSQARDPEAGAALIRFLAAPATAPVLKKKGMEGV